MQHSWAYEELSRAVCAAHLAEAERDRLVGQALAPRRSLRVALADALRALAGWLDDTPATVGDRRLARAL
jgi:hypothetical protein